MAKGTKKRIFIICPVRDLKPDEDKKIKAHIKKLENQGHLVHYPPRDTNQHDVEINICRQNRDAILASDEVHIFFNATSGGSKFDLGTVFTSGKPLYLINREDVHRTPDKSFDNFVLQLAEWTNA